ncbi:MAG TPA: leucyl aminopeptidase [Flavobacteriales bacterium]|nr:leucyl aminopeptidase [Flavobacteriales bacterium]
MSTKISITSSVPTGETLVLLGTKKTSWKGYSLKSGDLDYIKVEINKKEKELVEINQYDRRVIVQLIKAKKNKNQQNEMVRRAGAALLCSIKANKDTKVTIVDLANNPEAALALAEGMALGNYTFNKYKTKKGKENVSLNSIKLYSKAIKKAMVLELYNVNKATSYARSLVNEPLSYLTATKFSAEIRKLGKEAGFKVEVFTKKKIQALKMGGLLAVNQGSLDPPTFNIMEWKPRKAKNKKPYVLVGKGVVYDTGGLSLKPTHNSMDHMKCDMGGAAAVVGTMYAVAKSKLPIHIIGLIPATDNRPSGNAYVPGDVITMHDGTSVEVLNTDAEGRLILADALSYAKRYKPELVIDLATLTGAAMMAIGNYGIVSMQEDAEKEHALLKESGEEKYERLAEMPFWEEYGELIKSKIADIKNLGGPHAGAITAGKFLHHFTDYPWIHLDIAGPAYLDSPDGYRTFGGTGVGVRLLFQFFQKKCQ